MKHCNSKATHNVTYYLFRFTATFSNYPKVFKLHLAFFFKFLLPHSQSRRDQLYQMWERHGSIIRYWRMARFRLPINWGWVKCVQ